MGQTFWELMTHTLGTVSHEPLTLRLIVVLVIK